MMPSAIASVSMSIRERKGKYETSLSVQMQVVINSVSTMEEGSALVQVQTIVVHPSIVRRVLVWMTAQPLTPTLHVMRATLFVVSRHISSLSLNLVCSFISLGLTGLMHTTNTCTVCSISCSPGYTRNTTDCSCEFTDGCEAAGQPCQNGGNCVSDLLAPPYYSCQCAAGSTGQNCTSECMHL